MTTGVGDLGIIALKDFGYLEVGYDQLYFLIVIAEFYLLFPLDAEQRTLAGTAAALAGEDVGTWFQASGRRRTARTRANSSGGPKGFTR